MSSRMSSIESKISAKEDDASTVVSSSRSVNKYDHQQGGAKSMFPLDVLKGKGGRHFLHLDVPFVASSTLGCEVVADDSFSVFVSIVSIAEKKRALAHYVKTSTYSPDVSSNHIYANAPTVVFCVTSATLYFVLSLFRSHSQHHVQET